MDKVGVHVDHPCTSPLSCAPEVGRVMVAISSDKPPCSASPLCSSASRDSRDQPWKGAAIVCLNTCTVRVVSFVFCLITDSREKESPRSDYFGGIVYWFG
ncbi:hypothetical protein BaRGS_00036334 [Batillaria attramentaria]|uniref:Uncharacterized protein n=1 Tax=Batillaria attramentaria TaxID=370345 RepID=A0ABD0JBS7_9CAEN